MPPAAVLAREAIQNSVDARAGADAKVAVHFVAKHLWGSEKAAFVKAALRYNAEDRLPVEMPSRAKSNGKAERAEAAAEPAEVGS